APSGAEIEIYDLLGNRVWSEVVPRSAQAKLVWQPDERLPSGVYIVRATAGNRSATKRIIYLK
ncbi:T9SS type A sorting domain-containing protein, partial [bacterium]|nr:T9SS type A sorting domain-containing protein [bacterium]